MPNKISLEFLTGLINSSFTDFPYPGDENILSDFGKHEYPGGVTSLCGLDWRDLINQYDHEKGSIFLTNITDLSEEAFLYFLPGYMCVTAKYYHEYNVSDDVIYSLSISPAYSKEKHLERFEKLSLKQKHAVRIFLEYLIQEYSDDLKYLEDSPWLALEEYWSQF